MFLTYYYAISITCHKIFTNKLIVTNLNGKNSLNNSLSNSKSLLLKFTEGLSWMHTVLEWSGWWAHGWHSHRMHMMHWWSVIAISHRWSIITISHLWSMVWWWHWRSKAHGLWIVMHMWRWWHTVFHWIWYLQNRIKQLAYDFNLLFKLFYRNWTHLHNDNILLIISFSWLHIFRHLIGAVLINCRVLLLRFRFI